MWETLQNIEYRVFQFITCTMLILNCFGWEYCLTISGWHFGKLWLIQNFKNVSSLMEQFILNESSYIRKFLPWFMFLWYNFDVVNPKGSYLLSFLYRMTTNFLLVKSASATQWIMCYIKLIQRILVSSFTEIKFYMFCKMSKYVLTILYH